MFTFVATTFVKKLACIDLYEMSSDEDDQDEEVKKEKEEYIINYQCFPNVDVVVHEYQLYSQGILITNEKFDSELFCHLPELPPELRFKI